VIYSHFVDGFIDQIQSYVNNCGFTTKAYTGDEESNYRNIIIDEFTKGQFDILICSRPISTGVDGLQKVCNKLIILSLPWTSAEFEQLIGRFYRQGSNYKTVDVVIPQVFIPTNEGEWSFDKKRYDIITYKQTLANCVVDGVVVNKTISPEKILEKAIDALKKWKERLDKGEVISIEPTKLSAEFIEGTPEYKERQRNQLTEYNSRWGTMNSDTLHNELKASPEKWHEYHNLRGIAMQSWSEDPNVFVAKQIEKMSGDFHTTNIADMGCGINTLAGLVKNSTFKSFDHVAVNENVIACDIKDVSKHVEDEKMNVVVFCLALNAHNYPEFLTEGNRIMREKGNMLIVLPSNKPEKIQEVKEILAQYNLEPKEEITFSGGKFTYLRFSR
jgi:superfamily II DNA/RNA helicase